MLAFLGCSTPSGVKLNLSEIRDMNSQVKVHQRYILGYGDIISIKFLYNPELNNDTVTIGPDGKISMHLIGEVHAEGLTLKKLNTLLTEEYYKTLGYSLDTYTLGIGDTLSIKLLYNSELNSEVKVRPDGKISLPLIDEVMVAGKTPSQLKALVTDKYAKKLDVEETPEVTIMLQDCKIPKLIVSLMNSASQIVYTVGEVNQPKVLNMIGPMKVLQAIALSGGANNNAKLDSIILIRYSNSNAATAHLLDMNQVLAGKIPDVNLKPYDIVFVPKTSMAKTDIFMQRIWRMIPTQFLFSFPYNLNSSEITVTN
jgi:protein involved in polysaccharide export with SLBB domain